MQALILSEQNEGSSLPCGIASALLLPVLSRPAIWHLMTMLKDWGVTGVTFAPQSPKDLLDPVLVNGDRWGVSIEFPQVLKDCISESEDVLSGSGESSEWIVLSPGWVGMGVKPEFTLNDGSNGNKVIVHCSESDGSETGLWVLEEGALKRVLDGYENGDSLTCDEFKNLVKSSNLERVETTSFLLKGDISTIDDFLKTNMEALKGELPLMSGDTTEISTGVLVGSGTSIDPSATLTAPLYIGNNCVIAAGAVLSGSVIGDGTAVGRHCIINNSVIDSDTFVGNVTEILEAFARRCRLHKGGYKAWLTVGDPFLLSDINTPMSMSLKEIVKGLLDLAKDQLS
jgi:NDP-sugar pyrophosphorylase family protein